MSSSSTPSRGMTVRKRDGPMMLCETSTRSQRESLSQTFQLVMDTSPEQNRALMEARASECDPDAEQPDTGAIIQKHHAFHHWLRQQKPLQINISETLTAETTPQLLTLLRILAVTQQAQREKRDGWIDATLKDYVLVKSLLSSGI